MLTSGDGKIKVTGSMANQDAHLNDFIQIDQEDRAFQKMQSENREIEYSRDGSISFKPSGLSKVSGLRALGKSPIKRDESHSSYETSLESRRGRQ